MTVAELLAHLVTLPQDAEVLTWGSGDLAAMGDAEQRIELHPADGLVWIGLA